MYRRSLFQFLTSLAGFLLLTAFAFAADVAGPYNNSHTTADWEGGI